MSRSLGERAQATAEFALVAPILFLVVFGIIQLGYTFGKQLDLKGATRDGARRGAVSMDRPDAVHRIENTVRSKLALTGDDDVHITVTPAPPWNHGDRITVRTRVAHGYDILGVGVWTGDLRATSTIRVE